MEASKQSLISKYLKLKRKYPKKRITREIWIKEHISPSYVVVKRLFGSWGNFIEGCGDKRYQPILLQEVREKNRLALIGKRGPRWEGGSRKKSKSGYIYIYYGVGNHTKTEHRVVMEKFLGRVLSPKETVHHKNGIRDDNRLENLELWNSGHPPGQRVTDKERWAANFLLEYGYLSQDNEVDWEKINNE